MSIKAKKTASNGKVEDTKDPLDTGYTSEDVEVEGEDDEEYKNEEDGDAEYGGEEEGLSVVGKARDIEECHFKEERAQILELRDKAGETTWDLAVALQHAYAGGLYESWGFSSWKEYVEDEVDIHIRKAQQLVQIQEWCDKMPSNIQKWVRDLGYAKAREMVRVVTVENIEHWRELVEGKSLAEICKLLKDAKEEEEGGGGSGGGEGGEGGGAEEIAKAMNFKLFPGQKRVVEAAITKAKDMAGTEKPSHALELICTEFMASEAGIDNIQGYLKQIERFTGFSMIAYDNSKDEIIYGANLLQKLEILDEEDVDDEEVGEEKVEAEEEVN